QHQEPDLKVNIVIQAADSVEYQCPENPEWHRGHDGAGQDPGFELRGEQEENDDETEYESVRRRSAGLLLLVGHARPGIAKTLGKNFARHLFHRLKRGARAIPWRCAADNLRRGKTIEMGHQIRTGDITRFHHGCERDHLALVGPCVEPGDIGRRLPEWSIRLQDDVPNPAILGELAYLNRAELGL